ncbi:MAG: hypothetical protein V4508_06495 [Pseudomonadota bacterium]
MGQPPLILFHLKLVAKISLAVGALAALVLLAVLRLISGPTGETYGAIVHLHSLTREHLGLAMLLAGLLLVAASAVMTWLIAYYSSFRVAGPLYRFGQNLDLARMGSAGAPLGLRRGDPLGRQARAVERAIATVRAHHDALASASADAAQAAAAADPARYAGALARLKALDARVRL